MAGVCYVERKDIWCLIVFVALIIAPNSLSKALPGGVQRGHPKWDRLSHMLLLDSLFKGRLGPAAQGWGFKGFLCGRNT